jgi:hypothetical protein
MSSKTRLLILALLAANLAIALAALVLRLGLVSAPPGLEVLNTPVTPRGVFALVFVPVWMGLGWAFMEWRLASRTLTPAADFRRISVNGFIAASLMVLCVQVWLSASVVMGAAPRPELVMRLMTAFVGALLAWQGNFYAKSSPPSGEKAPPPARWTRHILRIGWGMAIAGVALMVASAVLPLAILRWATLVCVVVLLANNLANRKGMRAA